MAKIRLVRAAPKAAAIAVPVAHGGDVPEAFRAAAEVAGFSGKRGESCEVFAESGRVLLVGVGERGDAGAYRDAGALAAARLLGTKRIALDGRGISPDLACEFAAGAGARAWRFDRLITRPGKDAPKLSAIDLVLDDPDAAAPVWRAVAAVLDGQSFARELVAEPSNRLTPEAFVRRLEGVKRYGITLDVLKPAALREAGLGALLAVGQGSAHKPRLAVLRWAGSTGAPPVAFVGKGITFDTGGVCIKPADRMWEMRADMAGAAACVGAIVALARRGSPAPAVAVLALAENATGESSYRPGDVLRSYSGRTIEVVDTDAEGRLVLADALAWTAAKIRPSAMIDLATLTGSIVIALGNEMAGLFGTDAALSAHLSAAGAEVGEPVWAMPIGAQHREDLNSDIADIRHCATGRLQPDACQAAAFLREFAGDVPWAHLDIAGVELRHATDDFGAAGPTGFGVRLLDRLAALRFEEAEAP